MAADNSRRRKALVPQRLLAEHFADAVDWHDLAALVTGAVWLWGAMVFVVWFVVGE